MNILEKHFEALVIGLNDLTDFLKGPFGITIYLQVWFMWSYMTFMFKKYFDFQHIVKNMTDWNFLLSSQPSYHHDITCSVILRADHQTL